MKWLLSLLFFNLIILNASALIHASSEIESLNISITPQKTSANMGDTIVFMGNITNNGSNFVDGIRVYLSALRVTDGKEMTMSPEDWNVFDVAKIDILNPKESATYNWSMILIDSGDYMVYLTLVDRKENVAVISEMSELTIYRAQKLNPKNVIPVALGIPLLIFFLLWGMRNQYRKSLGFKRRE